MDYSKITTEELPKKLVEKHNRMLLESKTALQQIDRIRILEEKADQLSHWVDESKGKKREEYLGRWDASRSELDKIKSGLSLPSKVSVKDLESKVAEHEKAIEYWKKK